MTHGVISAPQPEAVEAGAVMLKRGGNAVDAAIACALVQGVVDPLMCSIAGVGTAQICLPGRGVHESVNFLGKAPAAARADMWADRIEGEAADGFGFRLRGRVNEMGYQSFVAPASLMAYWELARDYATIDWRDLVAPAIAHAELGRVVRPHVHAYITQQEAALGRVNNIERLRAFPATRRLFFDDDGELFGLGARIPNPDLADTLRRIAEGGADVFYRGDIAERMIADIERNGGLLTRDDLVAVASARGEPVRGSYRGLRITVNRPPGSGVVLLEMLNILENFDLAALGHNTPETIRILTETIKIATADKAAHMGDPDFVAVPVDRLTDKAYAAECARRIAAGERARLERMPLDAGAGDSAGVGESKDTTHISVLDADGNAVAMTHTLGMPSGVISPGLGFMYNGCMGIFDPRPGRAASIAPGKGYTSSMTPTMVFRDDAPCIVIGAPGATHITLAVMQVLVNVLDFGMSMADAIAAPRISVTSDAIDVSNRIPRFVGDAVAAMGYTVRRSPLSYAFAGVHGVMRRDGVLSGGADPGRDGMALCV